MRYSKSGLISVVVILGLLFSLNGQIITAKGDIAQTKLTVYTYESLLNWGLDSEAVSSAVFDQFEQDHDITINLVKLSDAVEIMTKLYNERNNPVADVVIGIDNTMVFRAVEQDLLEPYTPSNIDEVDPDIIDILDPEHHVIPYDYGLISLIYKNESLSGIDMVNLTLQDIITKDLASKIVMSNPLTSSTGLGFLLWTIAVHQKVLNSSWTEWWHEVSSDVLIKPSWGDAWSTWDNEASGRPIMVSYGTDPAYYNLFENEVPPITAVVSHENNKSHGWIQVEGIGLVKGTEQPELAKSFIDWFLSETVQQYIPENNWMYPANTKVQLPPSYDYALSITEIDILNLLLDRQTINASFDKWLDDWELAIDQKRVAGYELYHLSVLVIACAIIVIRRNRKKKRK
ncbi:MAG: thiamine ABC transporter substrate-binding protein [Candidatus Hodarchaeales archaeon]